MTQANPRCHFLPLSPCPRPKKGVGWWSRIELHISHASAPEVPISSHEGKPIGGYISISQSNQNANYPRICTEACLKCNSREGEKREQAILDEMPAQCSRYTLFLLQHYCIVCFRTFCTTVCTNILYLKALNRGRPSTHTSHQARFSEFALPFHPSIPSFHSSHP